MILPSFFLVDFKEYDNLPDIQLPENTYLSYKITTASISLIDSFYRKLFLSPKKYPFCLFIDPQDELNNSEIRLDKIVDFLISFSFHFKYIKTNYDTPLILFGDKADINKYISITNEAFKRHGYYGIEGIIIYDNNVPMPKNAIKNIRIDLGKNTDSLFSEYITLIKHIPSPGFSLFFILNNPREFPNILDIIQKAEVVIQDDSPQLYYLLKENTSLATKEHELLLKIELLEEQFNSLNNYHLSYDSTDSRYKRQNRELMNFYKNEYEILPLWYKRLGHIIKVITGKRTFRSLFNDNVRKYKN